MLAPQNQLKNEKDIKNVFKKGRVFREDFLVFRAVNNNLGNSRFGFVVSVKVSKKATSRNKIKRRLREAVRARIKRAKTGVDGLFIAAPGIEKMGFEEIDSLVDKIFLKTKLIND